MNNRPWNFYSAGQLVFGRGAIEQLGAQIARWKWQRVLIITDRRLREAGLVDAVLNPLARSSIDAHVFDGGEPEPSIEVGEKAVDAARHCKPQAIIGLGGGSNMDLAKFARLFWIRSNTWASDATGLYSHNGRHR
jgi:alcohol dehydrogenase